MAFSIYGVLCIALEDAVLVNLNCKVLPCTGEQRKKNCFSVAVYLLLDFGKVNGIEFDIITNYNPLNSSSYYVQLAINMGQTVIIFPLKVG